MGSKILAGVIIVIILLVGIFLLAPEAFRGIVPCEYMPDSSTTSDTEIHWQTRRAEDSSLAEEIEEVEETEETKETEEIVWSARR